MDHDAHESFPRDPFALGLLTFIVYAAGFATVAAWFALTVLDSPRSAPPRAACGVCGVVEAVREVEPAPAQPLEGSQAEGAVVLLAALGGAASEARDARARRVYETAVLHDDGYTRVLRDSRAPDWQRGDRVKVIMGRVSRDAASDEPRTAPQAAAVASAQTGRTPSPIPPVARVP